MILNVTNSKTMAKLTGSAYVEDWVGRSIIIGTEKVKAFGDTHDALRIRNRLPVSTRSAGMIRELEEADRLAKAVRFMSREEVEA